MSEGANQTKPAVSWLTISIVAAIMVAISSAIAFPLVLNASCKTSKWRDEPSSYRISINGQSEKQKSTQPQKPNIVPTSATEITSISANGSANPANDPGNDPNAWWERFWCDVTATDYFIALFTFFLVVAGIIQAVFVGIAWRESREATEIAKSVARATNIQARAMIELEKARLAFGTITIHKQIGSTRSPVLVGQLTTDQMVLGIPLINAGRTGANILAIAVEWFVGDEFPPIPLFPNEPIKLNQYLMPIGEQSGASIRPYIAEARPFRLDQTQIARIQTATDRLFVYGYVEFADLVGDTYRQRFAGHWEEVATGDRPIGRGLLGQGPDAYTETVKIGSKYPES